jgi:hypothetical protein
MAAAAAWEVLLQGRVLIPYLRQLQALAAAGVEAPESLRLAVDLEAAQGTPERLSAAHQHHRQVRVTEVEITTEVPRTPLVAVVEPDQVRLVELVL